MSAAAPPTLPVALLLLCSVTTIPLMIMMICLSHTCSAVCNCTTSPPLPNNDTFSLGANPREAGLDNRERVICNLFVVLFFSHKVGWIIVIS